MRASDVVAMAYLNWVDFRRPYDCLFYIPFSCKSTCEAMETFPPSDIGGSMAFQIFNEYMIVISAASI